MFSSSKIPLPSKTFRDVADENNLQQLLLIFDLVVDIILIIRDLLVRIIMINAFIVVVVVVVWFGDTVLFLFGLFLFGQKGAKFLLSSFRFLDLMKI